VRISSVPTALFNGVLGVQPATGWTATTSIATWSGSVDVPPNSALDFIVQIAPRNSTFSNIPITLTATTAAGLLTNATHITSQSNNNVPYVSLPMVVGGLQVFFEHRVYPCGSTVTGQANTFTIRVKESEQGNSLPSRPARP